MLPLLLLAFVLVPVVELVVILAVRDVIGMGDTIVLLLLVSLVGAWLVKREGIGVWRRLQHRLEAAEMPGREVVDGALVLLGGALMLTPGFVTDGVGLLLVLPPGRAVVRSLLLARFRSRLTVRVGEGRLEP